MKRKNKFRWHKKIYKNLTYVGIAFSFYSAIMCTFFAQGLHVKLNSFLTFSILFVTAIIFITFVPKQKDVKEKPVGNWKWMGNEIKTRMG